MWDLWWYWMVRRPIFYWGSVGGSSVIGGSVGGGGSDAIEGNMNGGEGRDLGKFGGVAVWDVLTSEGEVVT